jgi:membrane protein
MQKKVIAWVGFVQCAWQRFQATGCSYRAAALSFATLLSLIPLMTFGFSLLAKFPQFKTISQQIQNFIFANFLASSAQTITTHLHGFMERAAQLSMISLLFLLLTATLLMLTLEQTFNSIWRTPKRRHWTFTTLSYWLALLFIPLFIALSLFILSHFALPFLSTHVVVDNLLVLLPPLLSLLFFALLYRFVPHCMVPWRAALGAALFATFLFEIAKYGFSLYLSYFSTYKIIYGTLSAFPLFLVWIYICWLIILTGAVISYALTKKFVKCTS